MSRVPVIFALGLLLVVAGYTLAYFALPSSVVVPGRPVVIEGVVDHKKVGGEGQATVWYTVSIMLSTPDPINKIEPGGTLAYIVEKEDFDRVNPGDMVRAIVTGEPHADIL